MGDERRKDPAASSFLRGPRPTDPKEMLEWDIEAERVKIQQMEDRYRQEMDRNRDDHRKAVDDADKRHVEGKSQYTEEK